MLACLALYLAGCSSTQDKNAAREAGPSPTRQQRVPSPKEATESGRTQPVEQTPPPTYSAEYDAEIKRIFTLARDTRWEDAETAARALAARAPQDPMVRRVHDWVSKQRQVEREQALEDKIREVEADKSVFNPSIKDLLTETKDRGLPPRKDLRDAIDKIESAPYIPDTFGRTIQMKGQMFDVESAQGQMSQMLDKDISVHLDNVTLESIIFNVGEAAGVNFVADRSLPAFQQTLTVNVEGVKLKEFLRYVSRNMNVNFQVGDGLVWIVDNKTNVVEETRVFHLRKGFIVPAQFGAHEATRVIQTAPNKAVTETITQKIEKFVNDGAPDAPALEQVIKQFFDPSGSKFLIDYERNVIIARGTREELEGLESLIEEFDKPIQQVLIEARFITVSEAAFLQLGVNWETGRDFLAGGRVPQDFTAGLGSGIGVGLGLQETFTNVLGRANLSATLSALQQSGESQTLSAPRLTVVNNRPARISDGKVQYYYEQYTVKQQITDRATSSSLAPEGKPSKVTSGVTLEVVASIGGDGQSIMLALHPQVNQDVTLVNFATVSDLDLDTKQPINRFEIKLPELRQQELATRVVVKSGQTIVMGGVHEREQRTFVESVPILGNLPLIGAAFRKRTEVDRPRYLLIFVTATLLSETGEYIMYDEEAR